MDSQSQHLHQFKHQQPPPPPPQHHHQQPPPPQPQHHQLPPPPPPQHHQQTPPPPPQHHKLQPHQQQLNLPNNNNNSYPPNNPTPSPPPGMATTLISSQHQFQQNQQMQAARNPNSGGPFNSLVVANLAAGVVDAIVPATASGGGTEQAKKKRGRPRKYSPEEAAASAGGLNGGDHSGGGKKSRGKPLGPGNKQEQLDVSGAVPVGITAHVIYVKAGEDIAYTIMTFAQQGPDSVCILSATGSIRNATLRQAARSGGNVTYEGQFEIISLAGTFHPSENGARAGALSISLVGSDGHMVGGSVSGMLVAATPIQLVMGTFTSDIKKQKAKLPSASPSSSILNFSAPASGVASSPSQGASSESSEENNDSPPDNAQGPNINAGQPMQNMSMYSPVNFAYPIKMPPN